MHARHGQLGLDLLGLNLNLGVMLLNGLMSLYRLQGTDAKLLKPLRSQRESWWHLGRGQSEHSVRSGLQLHLYVLNVLNHGFIHVRHVRNRSQCNLLSASFGFQHDGDDAFVALHHLGGIQDRDGRSGFHRR